jgi:hypothetical protein
MRHIVRQRADCRRLRRRYDGLALDERRGRQACHQSGRRRFYVALDTRHLAGKQQRWTRTHLPRIGQHRGAVDVGVSVHHAEANELGALETRNEAQHALLFAPLQLRLETHQAEMIAGDVVLTQLHHRVRRRGRCEDRQADRLHRTEAGVSTPAMRHDFDGQAAFEELLFVEIVDRRRLRMDHRVWKSVIRRGSSDEFR